MSISNNKFNCHNDKNIKAPEFSISKYNLGIDNYDEWYIRILNDQNKKEEFEKVNNFVKHFCLNNDFEELKGSKIAVQFINYGDTQLVFVVTIDNNKQYTLLVNQPKTMVGQGKEEFNNLITFNKLHPDIIIKPIKYYVNPENPQQELYMTPYYYQARCVGVESKGGAWGEWIPEPEYHFREYSEKESKIIKKCIVALLVLFYDENNKKVICNYSLDGSDLMLKKGYENEELNEENIIKNMVFISARKIINIEFDEYIKCLKKELRNDFDENNKKILMKKLRKEFNKEDIEEGIKYGMKLREKNNKI